MGGVFYIGVALLLRIGTGADCKKDPEKGGFRVQEIRGLGFRGLGVQGSES